MHFPSYPLKLVVIDQDFVIIIPEPFGISVDDFLYPGQFFFQVQDLIHLLLIFGNNH